MTLPDLAHFQETLAPLDDPRRLGVELKGLIQDDIANQPRSQQTRIGPSEIGDPCTRCLGHKLAGIQPLPEPPGAAWLPYVGTAMHSTLTDLFMSLNTTSGAAMRWLVETTVSVGEIDGVDITGHADLFDLDTGTVIDWKLVGKTTLTGALKHGPSDVYRTQAHLYGRGFTRRGLTVHHVAIYYLPRNAINLAGGYFWTEPYDEAVALKALDRANALAAQLRNLGPDRLLGMLPAAPGCRSCPRYPLPDGSPFRPAGQEAADPFG